MLVKSTPICQKEQCKSTSAKRQSSHQYLFALLGSVCVKAAHRTLVKSTPGFAAFAFTSGHKVLNLKLY